MSPAHHFNADEIQRLSPTEKIGLLATVNSEGLPHITLITSLQPTAKDRMAFGQFSEGLSKRNIQNNPKSAFVLMTRDKTMWRGTARYTHRVTEGPEYEMFNEKPMFRYNSYFGVNTVYCLELVTLNKPEKLPMAAILRAIAATKLAGGPPAPGKKPALNTMARKLFNNASALKFISWIRDSGYPALVPVIQCRAAGTERVVFSPGPYAHELQKMPANTEAAVFALTLQMEDVLVRGNFNGFARRRGINIGTVDINWVYNSMPPAHGQVYPEIPVSA